MDALLSRAQAIHLSAAAATCPEPVQLARKLFAREMHDDFGAFDGLAVRYADVLGERGLAEYRRLAEAAWQKLQPKSSRRRDDEPPDFRRVIGILDFFAERDGDVDARIALRSKDLSSPYSYLRLAEFCLSQGREQEALQRAEEGVWMFEDGRQDERLLLFAVDLLAKANRKGDAERLLWRAFEKQPTNQVYAALRKLGGEAEHRRALTILEQACERERSKGWRRSSDLLVRVLLQEKMFDDAWAVLRKYGGSTGVSDDLARASEKTHAAQALEVYEQSVERLAKASSYAEAAKLVARMAKLRRPADQAAYLAALKERHGRKRNFMKLLG